MFQGQVQAIDPVPTSALFLSYISSYGSKPGNLMTPSDLLFDPVNKRLLVANGMSNIVSFGIDNGKNQGLQPGSSRMIAAEYHIRA